MNRSDDDLISKLFGKSEHLGVDRGLSEYRAGRPVLISGGGKSLLTLPVEGLDQERLAAFLSICAPVSPQLVITSPRARALGLATDVPMAVKLAPGTDVDTIHALVADVTIRCVLEAEPAGPSARAAVDLVKLAHGLPAVLAANAGEGNPSHYVSKVIAVDAEAVAHFRRDVNRTLKIAGQAQVPLNSATATRFVVFRDTMGNTPVAVIVGDPDVSRPIPVRLHSACLTGDAFGSRRCDCGDQLRLALKRLSDAGGGVILYLAQEGRGLGLANKIRTYKLQDDGLDTIDANTTLGFEDDERDYGVAARMLEMLGCTRIVLLTNNPAKLEGLTSAGIEITARMPLETPINSDNLRYMTAKAARAGHRLDHLLASLAEASDADKRLSSLAPSVR
jgi:GTP cyclohydrolase II